MAKSEREIKEDLIKLSDKKHKEFHSKLSPETDKILGVRVPKIREYAKQIVSEKDWEQTLNNIGDTYNEEKMLKGIIIGSAKIEDEKRMNYLKKFIPQIDSWSSCDITCASMKFVNKNRSEIWEFLKDYLNSENEFTLRFVIVMYLDYFITDEYVDEVVKIINNIKTDKYYTQMAIAWCISEMFIRYPEKAKKYMSSASNSSDKFTYNKALQKAIE